MLLRGTTAHVLLHVMCLLACGGERFQGTTNGTSLGISCTPRSTCRRPGMSSSEQAWKNMCIIANQTTRPAWKLQVLNTGVLRHSSIYMGTSFSRQGQSCRTLTDLWWWWGTCPGSGWRLCLPPGHTFTVTGTEYGPTQPPGSKAGPKGILRSWTSPLAHLPLSSTLSSPPGQALEAVCCRRWAETHRAAGALGKG